MLAAAAAHAADAGAVGEPSKPDTAQPNVESPRGDTEPDASSGGIADDLLRSFHRARTNWQDEGVTFSLHERSEVWANATGGIRRGTSYTGLTTGKLDLNLDKLMGWSGGEFYVSAFDIHGHGPTRSTVGNLQIVSNIEATPTVKLYDLWLDQSGFDGKLSVRVGQEGAGDELMTTTYAGLFLNSSFGFPGMAALVLPSGGPNYPLATPFARVQLKPTDTVTLLAAVFNGDPAPRGPGDPQIRDRNGTAFRLNDHTFSVAEAWYSPDPNAAPALPTTYKIGGWYASNQFADQRFDNAGLPLANPSSEGLARSHNGDWALYGIVDQLLWRRPGTQDQGIGAFLQVMGGPSDRNLSNLFVEAGVDWRAPFADRTDDTVGLAFSYLGVSPAARAFSRDMVAAGRAISPYAGHESIIEATYDAPLTNWLRAQPDLQYVINPGAGITNAPNRHPYPDALVLGLRLTVRL